MTTPTMFQEVDEAAQQQPHDEQPTPEVAPEREGPAASLIDKAVDETVARQQQQIQSEEDKLFFNQRLAKMFCKSGAFSDAKQGTPEQQVANAMVKIMLGEACGMSAVESMQSIYLVKGRPTLDAQVRAARMKRAGYSWVFAQLNEKGCVLIPCHKDQPLFKLPSGREIRCFVDTDGKPATVAFLEADARQAQLLPAKDDSNWKKYPVDMFFARAITRMQRRYASEVLNGSQMLDRSETDMVSMEDLGNGIARPLFLKRETEEGAA